MPPEVPSGHKNHGRADIKSMQYEGTISRSMPWNVGGLGWGVGVLKLVLLDPHSLPLLLRWFKTFS